MHGSWRFKAPVMSHPSLALSSVCCFPATLTVSCHLVWHFGWSVCLLVSLGILWLLLETPEEALLVDTSGTPPSNQEASQHQSAVFETRTKNPLVDEWALPIIVRLPQHTLTSYEHVFAHLPLLCTCHSTP